MAITAEALVFQLSARVTGFEDEIQQAASVFNRATARIEAGFSRMDRRIEESSRASRINMRSLVAAATGALGVRELIQYADAWGRAKNALTAARVPAQQQGEVLDRLFDQAQRYSTELNAQVNLFANVSRAAAGLTDKQEDLFDFTEAVAAALKADGQSAAQAAGPLLQLGQALRSPIIQAEEFNSLIDGAPALLEAAARGIAKYQGNVAALIRDAKEGNLASRTFFEGILAGADDLKSRVGASADTFEGAFTRINNALLKYIGSTDDSLSASQRVITGLNAFADNFDRLADGALRLGSIIAGALVGRAIGGLAIQIPLAIVAMRLLRLASIGAAQGATFLAANFGGATTAIAGATVASRAFRIAALGFFAGPIGFLIGGLAASMISLGEGASSSSDELADLYADLDSVGTSARGAADGIDRTTRSLEQLTAGQTARRLRLIDQELNSILSKDGTALGDLGALIGIGSGGFSETQKVIEGIDQMRGALVDMFRSASDLSAMDGIRQMAVDLQNGDIEAREVIARLDEIAATEVSSETDGLIRALEGAARKVMVLRGEFSRLTEEVGRSVTAMNGLDFRSAQDGSMAALMAARGQEQGLLDERTRRLNLDPTEREIEDRMRAITEELEKAGKNAAGAIEGAGKVMSEAAIRAQAESELRTERRQSAAKGGILDLIGFAEGTDKGRGYNESLGYGAFTGGARNLVNMTLDEIDALQGEMLRHPANDFNSSALGRYQIVRKTLRGLREELGLIGDEMFSPELQDRLAQQLLRRRGNDPVGLRNEWEGLRGIDDATIRSAFDGTSLNLPRVDPGVEEATQRQVEKRKELKQTIDDLFASTDEQTKMIMLETSMMNANASERERALTVARLEADLKRAGIPITDELRAAVLRLAEARGVAAAQEEAAITSLQRMEESQQIAMDRMDAFRDASRDVLGGFISDLNSGKSAVEALGNALGRISERLLDSGLDGIIAGLFGERGTPMKPGLGNVFSQVATGLFAGRRANGGSVRAGKVYQVGERGPEHFMPGRSGTIIPNGGLNLAAPQVRPINIQSSAPVIKVFDQRTTQSEPVETRQSGRNEFEVYVRDTARDEITTSGRRGNQALKRGYGVSQGLISR